MVQALVSMLAAPSLAAPAIGRIGRLEPAMLGLLQRRWLGNALSTAASHA
jgi:hypothetical protein